jgi:hypothetical protein
VPEIVPWLAVACASGGFKGVFVHGVLSALEDAGLRAAAYAGSSASVASTAFATVGLANKVGVDYWVRALRVLDRPDAGMSDVVLQCIADYAPMIHQRLFEPDTPRLLIPVSAVVTAEAAAETQTERARALGRRLLVAAARGDHSWADIHLTPHLFDSAGGEGPYRLDSGNFDAVAYASARMLHAWAIPAWVNGKPYLDASYTCSCPAEEMAEAGYRTVIAVATEPGPVYRDVFRTRQVSSSGHVGARIHIVRPPTDPKALGVDYADATEDGLVAAYESGQAEGNRFLESWTSPA